VAANTQAIINFHVIDTGNKPLLREAWLNYFYMDPSQVKGISGGVGLVGGLGFYITPGTNQTYTYSCSPDRPVRILSLASHMHEHATRMTVWKVAGDDKTLVYQSFDWANPPALRYDSVSHNPVTDLASQTAGAISGPLVVHPGESLQRPHGVVPRRDHGGRLLQPSRVRLATALEHLYGHGRPVRGLRDGHCGQSVVVHVDLRSSGGLPTALLHVCVRLWRVGPATRVLSSPTASSTTPRGAAARGR
jgi:hypothetical protein